MYNICIYMYIYTYVNTNTYTRAQSLHDTMSGRDIASALGACGRSQYTYTYNYI